MNDDATIASSIRKRSWRKHIIAAAVFLSLLVIIAGVLGVLRLYAAFQLESAMAEADRTDPNWRLEDLEASRAVYPDEDNGILVVEAAAKLLPKPWPDWQVPDAGNDRQYYGEVQQAITTSLYDLTPGYQLDTGQVEALRAELKRAASAIQKARELTRIAHGRKVLAWTPEVFSTLTPHVDDARAVAQLLTYASLLNSQDGDIDGSLADCIAAWHASRAIGDEPMGTSQGIRASCRRLALRGLERALGLGEASSKSLLDAQNAVEADAEENLFLHVARAERAIINEMMERIEDGRIVPATTVASFANATVHGRGLFSSDERDMVVLLSTPKLQHAAMLRQLTRMVEIAKLSPETRRSATKEMQTGGMNLPILSGVLMPAVWKMEPVFARSSAEARCAIAMLAAERYRRKHGKLPGSLDALVPNYISSVPLDPFDAKPLRYRQFDRGIIIYSIDVDEVDNNGNLDDWSSRPGTDLGFRLYDRPYRRNPPKRLELPKRRS
jgi:hypothetical protein